MIPYYIFLFVSLVLAYFTYKEQKTNRLFLLLLFLVLSLFAGLRSAVVGTDTSGYVRGFEDLFYLEKELGSGLSILTDEPGFYFLQKWLGLLSNEYYVLLTGIAIVFSFFVILSIGRQSKMPVLSLFVFITLGYYTFVFNAARQGIAMAIYMMAIPFIIDKQFWKYTLVVICAAMFHKSIVVAIPLYFFFTMRFSLKSVALALIGGVTIGLMLPAILDYGASLEARYELYTEGSATGGYLLTAFYVALAFFFVLQRRSIVEESLPLYDMFLNMLIVGSSIYMIVTVTGAYVELTRFAAYFQIASAFLWPILLKDRVVPLNRMVIAIAIVGHLGFFAVFLSRMANLTPYLLNPIVYGLL